MSQHPINKALHRPKLTLGTEVLPLLVFVVPTMAAGGFAFARGAYVTGPIFVFLAILILLVLRGVSKHDPQMFAIFMRSVRYRKVYPPRPSVFFKGKRFYDV